MPETDRSRIISYQRCPRERYLAYHHLGTGLQRTRKSLPLSFGSAFHEGCEELLTGKGIENAVGRAQEFLNEQFNTHAISFDGELPADAEKAMEYGREEQMALAEALLRSWWAYEGQSFVENFEIVEVESEGRAQLADDLTLMFRPDALVRDKQSGDYFVLSWKTCATFGPLNVRQARTDMQSMSEVFGLTQSRGVKIEGVLYRWAVKGSRRLDSWDKIYKQGSHLAYGWVKLDSLKTEFPEWSWCYEFETEDGRSSRLGKGWQKKSIWNNYPGGVKQWIDDLSHNRIFPRHVDAIAAIFPQARPVERRADEVESWKRQVVEQELEVGAKAFLMANDPDSNIDKLFPQYTHSCHSWSGCPFIPVCWEGAKAEPGELYQIRSANHPEKENGDE